MPMIGRLLRPLHRLGSFAFGLMFTQGGDQLTTINGDVLRTIQNA